MNQIIYPEKIEKNLELYKENLLKKKRLYKFLFFFSVVISIIFIGYYIVLFLKLRKVQNISKNILSVYNIQKLYSNNSSMVFPNIISESGDIAQVLGIIQIDKINLRLPILSKCTDEFLKIAPCKFYGNSLESYGNFCIAGHNFDNGEFFSNLKLLNYGDIINIYPIMRIFYFL